MHERRRRIFSAVLGCGENRWLSHAEAPEAYLGQLEDSTELCEGIQLDQMLALRRGVQSCVFQNPCVLVEEEDGVQAGGEGGIDVALGAVADHPARVRRQFMPRDHFPVGGWVLLRHN